MEPVGPVEPVFPLSPLSPCVAEAGFFFQAPLVLSYTNVTPFAVYVSPLLGLFGKLNAAIL